MLSEEAQDKLFKSKEPTVLFGLVFEWFPKRSISIIRVEATLLNNQCQECQTTHTGFSFWFVILGVGIHFLYNKNV